MGHIPTDIQTREATAAVRRRANCPRVLYIADVYDLLPYDATRKGRSSPLWWGKFRSVADCTESGLQYQMRRQAVKASGRAGWSILGVYDEILSTYGFARTAALRGWLVNHHYQAATAAQVAQTIGLTSVKAAQAALEVLTAVGLLVWVDRPDFAEAIRLDKTLIIRTSDIDRPPPAAGAFGSVAEYTPGESAPRRPDDDVSRSGNDRSLQPGQGERENPLGCLNGPDGKEPGDDTAVNDSQEHGLDNAQAEETSAGTGGGVRDSFRPAAGQRGGDLRRQTGDTRRETADPRPSPPSAQAGACASGGFGDGRLEAPHSSAPAPAAPPPAPTPGSRDGETRDERREPVVRVDASGVVEITLDDEPPAAAAQPTEADRPRPVGPAGCEQIARTILAELYPDRTDLVTEGRKASPPQEADEFARRELGCILAAVESAAYLSAGEFLVFETRSVREARRIRRKPTRKPRGALWRHWAGRHIKSRKALDNG